VKNLPGNFFALLLLSQSTAYDDAQALLREGRSKHDTALLEQALARLLEVPPDAAEYGKSRFTAGVVQLEDLGRPDAAIKTFEGLIDSTVDDRDATGRIGAPFWNYRYHAWRMIGRAHAREKRTAKALAAAWSMRKAFVSHCDACAEGMRRQVEEHLIEFARPVASTDEAKAEAGATSPEAFLLALGRRQTGDRARATFKLLRETFPDSLEAAEAGRLLGKDQ